ncbi:hypothetical protein [Helicobacter canis]|uniref:hypothetical protein n=1 Tax=Helicobacter canis TaxID=29419 RepID=UPI0011C06B62|nr:hypothetical protein [Helicobacter canis]
MGDSVLGGQCGSVAAYGKGTNAKFANLYHKPQSYYSPTATLRIVLKSNRLCEKAHFPSLRADKVGVAIHFRFQKVDSRI